MGTLTCRLELSKETGLTITAENPDDGITQTVVMDGTSITMTVSGSETSRVTQTADGVTVSCKDFTVDAETVTVRSSKSSRYQSGKGFEIKGETFALAASGSSEWSAKTTAIKSSASASILGQTLSLEGKASAKVTAPKVALDAKGILDLKAGGVANLKGSLTNVGGVVKLG